MGVEGEAKGNMVSEAKQTIFAVTTECDGRKELLFVLEPDWCSNV